MDRIFAAYADDVEVDLAAARLVYEAAVATGDRAQERRVLKVLHQHATRAIDAARGLREDGDLSGARDVLERALKGMPPEHPACGLLCYPLADDACFNERWQRALELTGWGLAALPDEPYWAPWRIDLYRVQASTFIQRGTPDQATAPLEAIDELRGRPDVAVDLRTELAVWRLRAEQWLATDRFEALVDEIGAVVRELDEQAERDSEEGSEPDAAVLAERAQLALYLGLAHAELAVPDRAVLPESRTWLTEAFDEAQSALGRFNGALRLAWVELLAGHPDASEAWLERARESARATEPTDYQSGHLAALEARLALERSADPAALRPAYERLSRALDRMIERWNESAPRPGGVGFLRYGSRRFVVATLLELALRLDPEGGACEALGILYRVRACGTLVRRLEQPLRGFDHARSRLLNEGAGALVYFTGRDRSHVFALERDGGIDHEYLPGELDLRSDVRAFGRWMAPERRALSEDRQQERAERAAASAAQLARTLIPEGAIRDRVAGWSELTILGSDLLQEPDFEALPLDGAPLGLQKPIAYLGSLAEGEALAARAETRTARGEGFALVGGIPTERHPRLAPLALSHDGAPELDLDAFDTLAGDDATRARILAALADRAAVFFVTHGIRAPLLERPSQILITPTDGVDVLGCADIEAHVAPPTVFLGVCSSGRGPEREGAGPVAHLGGAFLLAGADSVQVSDSDLALGPTLTMVDAFAAALRAGRTPAEALRLARVAVVERGWEDARSWATMRTIGLGHRPPAR